MRIAEQRCPVSKANDGCYRNGHQLSCSGAELGPNLGPKLLGTAWAGWHQPNIRLAKSPEKPDRAGPADTEAHQTQRRAFSAWSPFRLASTALAGGKWAKASSGWTSLRCGLTNLPAASQGWRYKRIRAARRGGGLYAVPVVWRVVDQFWRGAAHIVRMLMAVGAFDHLGRHPEIGVARRRSRDDGCDHRPESRDVGVHLDELARRSRGLSSRCRR
jgi:hypothetical protein